MTVAVNQEQFKELRKTAFSEALEERRDMLQEAVKEALEEIALARAIEEGKQSAVIGRDEVFALLESRK